MFAMSKRELEAKFTKSEIVFLAWRSQEVSFKLDQGMETSKSSAKNIKYSGQVPSDLPDEFFNEKGEIDLRGVTGEQAYNFFSNQGIHLPIMHGSSGRARAQEEMERQKKDAERLTIVSGARGAKR